MDALISWVTYVQNNASAIFDETVVHAGMTIAVVLAATICGAGLGIAVRKLPLARSLVLTVASIFLTIPALAFFALFVPLVGIGNAPAMCALFLYALLPILRNTLVGLDGVDPSIVESAKGMGMTPFEQFYKIRLPLAWPLIMAGVRVATLLIVGVATIASLVGGDGLGTFIDNGLGRLGLPNSYNALWTGTVFTLLLGLALDFVLAGVQRLTTARGLRR